jgi:hypothetical protein
VDPGKMTWHATSAYFGGFYAWIMIVLDITEDDLDVL